MIPPPTITASNRSTRGDDRLRRRGRHHQARSTRPLAALSRARGTSERDDPSDLLDAALRGGVRHRPAARQELSDDELVVAAQPFRRACSEHGRSSSSTTARISSSAATQTACTVGQGDAPVADARRSVGLERIVGLSVTTSRSSPQSRATPTISASAPSSGRRRSRSRPRAGSSSSGQRVTASGCRGSRSAGVRAWWRSRLLGSFSVE